MNAKELSAAVEAMLFASGEPLEIIRIAEVLGCDAEQVDNIVLNLATKLEESGSGLCVLKLGDKAQMCSRQEFAPLIREILDLKRNTPLSAAAFEVLAVIAYNQPVTRTYIDTIRGVDSNYSVNSLIDKELIAAVGRLDAPGRPTLYGTTEKFLRVFGLSSIEDLPETELMTMNVNAEGEVDTAQMTMEIPNSSMIETAAAEENENEND
jgi:segregation and condensation protein B